MKKYSNNDNPLKSFAQTIRKDIFKGKEPLKQHGGLYLKKAGSPKNSRLRRLAFITSFCMIGLRVFAPGDKSVIIAESNGILPFSDLMYAIGMVETMGNPMAYNLLENAVGVFQIRQVKVDEYNRQTGSKYVLTDMYNCSNSEKVFLYFASLEGPYQFEKIAKAWNGSGPMTEVYWKRIKEYL